MLVEAHAHHIWIVDDLETMVSLNATTTQHTCVLCSCEHMLRGGQVPTGLFSLTDLCRILTHFQW